MRKPTPEPLMDINEVSEYLKVPVATLHQWRYQRTGPDAAKIGRSLRYRRDDVDAWIESQTRRTA